MREKTRRAPATLNFQSRSNLLDGTYPGLGLALVVIIALFSTYDLAKGATFTGALGIGAALILLADLRQLRRHRQPLLNRALLFTFLAVIACIVIYQEGIFGIYWAYSLLIAIPMLLGRRAAIGLSILLLAALAPIIGIHAAGTEAAVRTLSGLVLNSVFAFVLATLVHRHGNALEQQVITDPLTGAYNRRQFNMRLAQIIEKKSRHGHSCSLILFDIDHFKGINDSYGHAAGDQVLRLLTDTVKARVRVVDELFRYGGEEFAILLPDTTLDAAGTLAQEITDIVAKVQANSAGPVTISSGVGELLDDEEADGWLQRCDFALYEAKGHGRGRIWLAPEELPAFVPNGAPGAAPAYLAAR